MANVRVNISPALSKVSGKALDEAIKATAPRIARDCSAYLKSRSGALAGSARVSENGRRITWATPYARKIFYKSKTGGRHWAHQARVERGASWAEALLKEIGKR